MPDCSVDVVEWQGSDMLTDGGFSITIIKDSLHYFLILDK